MAGVVAARDRSSLRRHRVAMEHRSGTGFCQGRRRRRLHSMPAGCATPSAWGKQTKGPWRGPSLLSGAGNGNVAVSPGGDPSIPWRHVKCRPRDRQLPLARRRPTGSPLDFRLSNSASSSQAPPPKCKGRVPLREPSLCILERAMGIEPTPEAWEAAVLPLNYARVSADSTIDFRCASETLDRVAR